MKLFTVSDHVCLINDQFCRAIGEITYEPVSTVEKNKTGKNQKNEAFGINLKLLETAAHLHAQEEGEKKRE